VISGSFEVKDFDDSSDSEGDTAGFVDGQDLCLPALRYLRQCCDIIASMCRMPACPVFAGAQRYGQLAYFPALLLFLGQELIPYLYSSCCFFLVGVTSSWV